MENTNNTNHLTLENLSTLQSLVGRELFRTFDDGTSVHPSSQLEYLEELRQNLQATYNDLSEQQLLN